MPLLINCLILFPGVRGFKCKSLSQSFSLLSCCMKSHYEALGVPKNATHADIKAAYYKLSMIYHPDKNETTEAAESFRAITEAYEVVGNFKLRKMYDKGLLGNLGADNSARRSYTNYNPSSSIYKNKPTHRGRTSAYNFDEWSEFHYGDVFSKRFEAKIKYEEKTKDESMKNRQSRNENVVYTIFVLTVLGFMVTYNFKASLDEPTPSSKK